MNFLSKKTLTSYDITKPDAKVENGTQETIQYDDEKSEQGYGTVVILRVQNVASNWYKLYGKYVKWSVYAILAVLYFVYFGIAMHHEFGSEPSIRLLWYTAFVVFIRVVLHFELWGKLCSALEPINKKITPPVSEAIAWILGIVLLVGLLAFVIVDAIVITKEPYNLVSLSGLVLYLLLGFLTSAKPAEIKWRPVLYGVLLQLILALLVLRWEIGFTVIRWVATRTVHYLDNTEAGSIFAFGESYYLHRYAFRSLPVVIFVSSTIAILYHFGIMQRTIQILGWILQKTLCTTAAESMAAAGNIFVGNTEAPLLVLPMIKDMTKSEINCLMVGGFSTIAGAAFGFYITLGASAEHLVAASIMSAPAALALSKLSYPETEESKTTVADVGAMYVSPYRNVIEAASSGAIQSIRLVANVTVNLITFTSLLAFVNSTLIWFGHRAGLYDTELTFGLICSYLLYPFALTMGVELDYCRKVAEILGIKVFVDMSLAYRMIGKYNYNREAYDLHIMQNGTYDYIKSDIILYHADGSNSTLENGILSERASAIVTFALCGFSHTGSIGIVMGALVAMAPERKKDFSEVVIRAILLGNMASYMTACFAGLLFRKNSIV